MVANRHGAPGIFMSSTYRDAYASRSPGHSVPVLFVKHPLWRSLVSAIHCDSRNATEGVPYRNPSNECREFFFPSVLLIRELWRPKNELDLYDGGIGCGGAVYLPGCGPALAGEVFVMME